ncbi:unnamed protein product, partial [Effrenium voratum]
MHVLFAMAWDELHSGLRAHATAKAAPAPGIAAGERSPRVAVVGAGVAGLATALGLARRGWHVTLVEALGRLGGRARTAWLEASGAGSYDLGATWVHGRAEENPLARYAEHLPRECSSMLGRGARGTRTVFAHDGREVDSGLAARCARLYASALEACEAAE